MLDINDLIRIIIIVVLVASFILSIVAVYQIPKRLQTCPPIPNAPPQTAGDLLLSSYFYPFTRDELTLVSLISAFSVMSFMLAFLVFINNFRVTSLIFAIPLIAVSSIVLSTIANLTKDPSIEIRQQYSPDNSISTPILYASMSATIIACVLTLYYYGRHFVKDLRHVI
jgi:hypothetical protein